MRRFVLLSFLPIVAGTVLVCRLSFPAQVLHAAVIAVGLLMGSSLLVQLASRLLTSRASERARNGCQEHEVSARDWLVGKFRELGLPLSVVRTKHGAAYSPEEQAIELHEDEADSGSPEALANAAHELAHAIFHDRHPWLARVLLWVRGNAGSLLTMGFTAVLANLMVPMAWAPFLARLAVLAASLASLVVLVEEALTSRVALELLADDGMGEKLRRKAGRSLFVSLLTYVLGTVRTAGLALLVPWFTSLAGPAVGIPTDPGWPGSLAVFLAVILGGFMVFELVWFALARDPERLSAHLGLYLGVLVFVTPLATASIAADAVAAGYHTLLFGALLGAVGLVFVPLGLCTVAVLTPGARHGGFDSERLGKKLRRQARRADTLFVLGQLFKVAASPESWSIALILALALL